MLKRSFEFSIFESITYTTPIDSVVFLGSEETATMDNLKSKQITYVLNVANEVDDVLTEEIHYLKLPLIDKKVQDISAYFEPAIQFINEAKKNNTHVLVHCRHGMSRSVSIVAAWLMYQAHLEGRCTNAQDVLEFIQKERALANPNESFKKQLHQYGETLNSRLPTAPALNKQNQN